MDVSRVLRGGILLVIVGLLAGVLARAADDNDRAVKLTPVQFDKEFRRSQKKTTEKYKGRSIELTGKVLRATRDFSGKPIVELEAGNPYSGLTCYTAEKEPWGTFARGQTVKVTGKFPDFPVVPSLEECTVKAVTKSPLRSVTAAALARECEADPAGTNKKMDKMTLKVTGTVASREFDAKTSFTDVVLKGTGTMQVACRLIPAEKESGAALQVGKTATVVGEFGASYEGRVHVASAVVLSGKE